MTKRLSTLFVTVVCLLVLPAVARAQFPSPTYGWNLGNTMEPPSGIGTWNNPAPTQGMINAVAAAGFNTIRIPCAWDSNANASFQIDSAYMAAVKDTVDWSLDAGMTVVINTHWDGGWLENNIGDNVNSTIDAKMDSYWTQIATTFSSYDERLLFAAANEPNVDNADQMSTLTHYYQTFVDAVRDVGGNNTSRWLVVQGPSTDIDKTDNLMNTLPNDPTEDRMVVEVHYYSPYQFTLMTADQSWGNQFYFWGEDYHSSTLPEHNPTWGEEDYLEDQLQKMNTKFVSQGVPVLLGEFGAINRTLSPELTGADLDLHLASRAYFHQQVTDVSNSMGIAPVYWDNGDASSYGDWFSVFNRNTGAVIDQDMVDALTGGPGGLTGDYNDDGVVDAADYTVWRDAKENGDTTLLNRDLSKTGQTVDEDDYMFWRENFGMVLGSGAGSAGSAPVPEPSALSLLLVAGAVLFGGRGRRSRAPLP